MGLFQPTKWRVSSHLECTGAQDNKNVLMRQFQGAEQYWDDQEFQGFKFLVIYFKVN